MVVIRKYIDGDEEKLWEIYFGAIRNICIRDYTDEQVKAWAPDDFDRELWRERIKKTNPYIAVLEDEIVGYTDLQDDGYIDHFFVDYKKQRRGIGNALMNTVIADAKSKGIDKLYSYVSKTAKDFYVAKSFKVIRENTALVRGINLNNFIMERDL